MTKEDFLQLQSDYQASDLSLKLYLKQKGTYYTTYNYWRRKYRSQVDVMHDLAPISILGEGTGLSYLFVRCAVRCHATVPQWISRHLGDVPIYFTDSYSS